MKPFTLGSILAICILVLVIVLLVLTKIPLLIGCLIGGLALARLT